MNRYEQDRRDDDNRQSRRDRRDEGILERIKNDVKSWFDDDHDDDEDRVGRAGYGGTGNYGSSRVSRRQEWDHDSDRFRNLGSRSRFGRQVGRSDYGEDEDYGQGRNWRSAQDYDRDDDYGQRGSYASGRSSRYGEDYRRSSGYGQSRSYGQGRGRSGYGGDEYSASERSGQRVGAGTPVWLYSEYYWITPGPHSGIGPKNFARSSDSLRERVCERLQGNGELDAADIEVQIESDEVTLTGTVKDRQQKRMAENCAESVYGVRDVHNRLAVKRDDNESKSRSTEYGSEKRSVN